MPWPTNTWFWRATIEATLAEAMMGELSTTKRNALDDSAFGLPHKRSYPMPDESHARNAKARAVEEYKLGNLTSAEKAQVDRQANAILGRA